MKDTNHIIREIYTVTYKTYCILPGLELRYRISVTYEL